MSTTYVIRLDERRMKLDQTYPVKLWVTYERKSAPYSTIFCLTKLEYSKLKAPNLKDKLKDIKDKLRQLETTVIEYLKDVREFNFEQFEMAFVSRNPYLVYRKTKKSTPIPLPQTFDSSRYEKKFRILKEDGAKKDNLLGAYISYIVCLLKLKSVRTADIYQTAYYSLFSFCGNIGLAKVNKQFLREYDVWLRDKGRSKSTVGIYMRTIRKIFNNAIEEEILSRKDYPFGRNKYIIPSGRNIKKALDSSYMKAIYYYKPEKERESFARDTWLFLYFGNGMNPKDMALLKYKNIVDGFIAFDRAKIQTTAKEDSKPILVYITEDLKNIIDRWGNKNVSDDTFIFPIFNKEMDDLTQMIKLQEFVRITNNWMKKIFERLGYDKKSTTMVARHSFSTHMLYSGASKELIQESLGHLNIKTTENYLDSFQKPVIKEFAEKLCAFKDES